MNFSIHINYYIHMSFNRFKYKNELKKYIEVCIINSGYILCFFNHHNKKLI